MVKETYLFSILPDAHIRFVLTWDGERVIIRRSFTRKPKCELEVELGMRLLASEAMVEWLQESMWHFSNKHDIPFVRLLRGLREVSKITDIPIEDDRSFQRPTTSE